MTTTSVSRVVPAPRAAVYRALLDPAAVATWRVPDGMRAEVHEWEPREGGPFRVSLTYDDPGAAGKSAGATDTYAGRFDRLVDDEQVVEVLAFETDDPSLAGDMTMTTTLHDVPDGTEVVVRHDGIPDGLDPADNELGTLMALDRLAEHVG